MSPLSALVLFGLPLRMNWIELQMCWFCNWIGANNKMEIKISEQKTQSWKMHGRNAAETVEDVYLQVLEYILGSKHLGIFELNVPPFNCPSTRPSVRSFNSIRTRIQHSTKCINTVEIFIYTFVSYGCE